MQQQVSIVTGAGSGIGAATARMLAARGHAVVLVGRRVDALESTRTTLADPSRHFAISADVADAASSFAVIDRTIERYGRIDALILAAGIAPRAMIEDTTPAMLHECFSVNTFGIAYLVTRAWPHMQRQRAGRIALVSTLGTSDPFTGFFAYAASKSAIDSFARSIKAEGDSIGVKAFAINPGCVETAALRNNFCVNTVPRERALAPDVVAAIITACICGERDGESGSTIVVASP